MKTKDMSRDQLLNQITSLNRKLTLWKGKDDRYKQMEETLRISRNVFNSLHSFLIAIDRDAKVTRWNSAVELFTGKPFTHPDVRAGKVWEMIPFLAKFQNSLFEVIDTGQAKEMRRQRVRLQDAQEINYFDISIYPILSDKAIKGAVIEIEDKTELVKKDQQLLQAQKMETVGNLAGGLAHDFNNVLGGITGAVSLLKYSLQKNKCGVQDKIIKEIDIIEVSANRAAGMVKQLLALSRKKEPRFQSMDLNDTLKYIEKICRNTFDKCLQLDFCFYPQRARTVADPTQMEQVLLNLCVNASHAMTIMRENNQPQGGTLTVSLEKTAPLWTTQSTTSGKGLKTASMTPSTIESTIALTLDSATDSKPGSTSGSTSPSTTDSTGTPKDYWLLRVHDTGVGMSAQTMSRIFDPFFSTKKNGKGTGLGMAMVYNILKQHNAFIEIYSEPGSGSQFNIYLPVVEKETKQPIPKRENIRLPIGSGLVLVVDDEEVMRRTAARMFRACGYDVITAKSGNAAIKAFEEKHKAINLVFLDMAMPRLSGKETYLKLKEISPQVKVLLASGSNRGEQVKELIKMGIAGFISKPFSLYELAKKILAVTDRSAQRQCA